MPSTSLAITIRPACPGDARALVRLAQLDSTVVPSEPLLVAEVEGQLRVAVSILDGAAIADPFVPTDQIVHMVRDHIERAHRASTRGRFGFRPALAALRAG